MPARFFVSYRHDLDPGSAGRIRDRLTSRFGESSVFMDIDSILGGEEFWPAIEKAIGQAHVLLAVIEKRWSQVQDEKTGRRRLENPDDYVVREISVALSRGIPVIPVLVNDADLPSHGELPAPLRPLVDRQAVRVHHQSFDSDIGRLIKRLAALSPEPGSPPRTAASETGRPGRSGGEMSAEEPAPALQPNPPPAASAPRPTPAVPVSEPGARAVGAATPFGRFATGGTPPWALSLPRAPVVPPTQPRDPSVPRSVEDLFGDAFDVPADSWVNRVGTWLVKGALRILPRSTSTTALRGIIALCPAFLLLCVVLAGFSGEAVAERATGEPFVFALDPGLFNYALAWPAVGAVVGFAAFWAVRGGNPAGAWLVGIGCELCGMLLVVVADLGPLAWMVHNQRFSQADSYGWVGVSVVAVLIVLCWLGLVSWLVLWDRRIAASRSIVDRCFPVVVGALAVVVAGIAVLLDIGSFAVDFPGGTFWLQAGAGLSSGGRWVAYLAAWTLLGACATALVVEGQDRASGWRAFVGGIAAVALAVAGSITGFVLVG